MKINIRKATLPDCEAICKIHVSSIRELGTTHYSEDELDVWARGRTPKRYEKHISERYVLIAEHHSNPVGFGTLDLLTGEIVQLYIHPEYAGQGVGSHLLENLMEKARDNGMMELNLLSSLNAEQFYAKFGFRSGKKQQHIFSNGEEIDCIPMKLKLE